MYDRGMKTVIEIIERWPTQADFADDCGVKWMTAHQWRLRNRIPPEHWPALVKAATRRGIPLTEKLLAEMTAAQKRSLLEARATPRKKARKPNRQAVSA